MCRWKLLRCVCPDGSGYSTHALVTLHVSHVGSALLRLCVFCTYSAGSWCLAHWLCPAGRWCGTCVLLGAGVTSVSQRESWHCTYSAENQSVPCVLLGASASPVSCRQSGHQQGVGAAHISPGWEWVRPCVLLGAWVPCVPLAVHVLPVPQEQPASPTRTAGSWCFAGVQGLRFLLFCSASLGAGMSQAGPSLEQPACCTQCPLLAVPVCCTADRSPRGSPRPAQQT